MHAKPGLEMHLGIVMFTDLPQQQFAITAQAQ